MTLEELNQNQEEICNILSSTSKNLEKLLIKLIGEESLEILSAYPVKEEKGLIDQIENKQTLTKFYLYTLDSRLKSLENCLYLPEKPTE